MAAPSTASGNVVPSTADGTARTALSIARTFGAVNNNNVGSNADGTAY